MNAGKEIACWRFHATAAGAASTGKRGKGSICDQESLSTEKSLVKKSNAFDKGTPSSFENEIKQNKTKMGKGTRKRLSTISTHHALQDVVPGFRHCVFATVTPNRYTNPMGRPARSRGADRDTIRNIPSHPIRHTTRRATYFLSRPNGRLKTAINVDPLPAYGPRHRTCRASSQMPHPEAPVVVQRTLHLSPLGVVPCYACQHPPHRSCRSSPNQSPPRSPPLSKKAEVVSAIPSGVDDPLR